MDVCALCGYDCVALYVVLWAVLRVTRLFNACVLSVIDCAVVRYVCCVWLFVCVCLCVLVWLMCCVVWFTSRGDLLCVFVNVCVVCVVYCEMLDGVCSVFFVCLCVRVCVCVSVCD